MQVQISAGDTVIWRDKSRGIERGGQALQDMACGGLWVTTNPKSVKPVPNATWVRPEDIVEVRPRTQEERLAAMKAALTKCLIHGEGECKMVSSRPSYFKRSSGVRR